MVPIRSILCAARLPAIRWDSVLRPPFWVADLIVGTFVALFAVTTVAQAALPSDEQRTQAKERSLRQTLRPAQVVAPAFVFGEPVAGHPIISPFGLRQLPWEKHGRLHAGVDIAAPAGTPVLAVADGVVTRAGTDGGYGRFVEVRHAEGVVSLYAHLGAIAAEARPGTAVTLGTSIGLIGSTGTSTGAHLHFEIRDAARRPLNPELFVGRQFAAAGELPLKDAARIPRRVRMAYVSFIPHSKRELMERKDLEKLEEDAARAEAGIVQTAALAQPAPLELPLIQMPKGERPRAVLPGRPVPAAPPSVPVVAAEPAPAPAPAPRPRAPAAEDDDGPIATAA